MRSADGESQTEGPAAGLALDPELQALPAPRRPWRRTTLASLFLVVLLSLGLIWGLWPPAEFAAWRSAPRDLGDLRGLALEQGLANAWVHAEGTLGSEAAEYRRPLDRDRYWLAPVAGTRLWVELRIPEGIEPERYVPPNSFVGRLVPLAGAGLGGSAIRTTLAATFGEGSAEGAWILFDGEAPSTSRWAIGLIALFCSFAAFGTFGIVRLLVPARLASDTS